MQIGMVGPGRMGGNMTRRLLKKGHASVMRFGFGGHVEKPRAANMERDRTLHLSPPTRSYCSA
jgi:6-phosphogluconate dehydrogenase (decarboxylating)